jgi:hypothetical protein
VQHENHQLHSFSSSRSELGHRQLDHCQRG